MSAAPGIVAEEAKAAGASSLVHISAIGADPASESNYGRTKGQGEAAVRKAFPEATIIRPSLVFGAEDELTNRFARMGRFPIVPVLAPKTKFQPVYVRDLAQAIAAAALDPAAHGGKIYEIAGPEVVSMLGLHRAIYAVTGQDPELVALPNIAGRASQRLGFPPRRAADPRPVADAPARQCRRPRRAWPQGVRDRADPARRGRRRMARSLPRRQGSATPTARTSGRLTCPSC